MNSFQSIIKIFAVCLAIFIIINIFSALLFGIGILTNILNVNNKYDNNSPQASVDYQKQVETYQDVREIKIELISAKLTITTGEQLKVEIDESDTNINSRLVNDTLKIEENKPWRFWNNTSSGNIILYIPENMDLRKIKLDTGAGKINIEGIKAREIDINHGAGLLEISNSNFNEADVDGGAGRISIEASKLNNLDFEAGVGKIDINAEITGRSKIECGIGEMNIRLIGRQEDYNITAEKGIGSLKINGEEASSNITYGHGANTIKLNGGIGSIDVKFE